ncbi:hypothetical protein CLPU_9c00200 [Gottschalkia purinilytica]|uniref:Uncharacterized protein n=1 Tax=Gottschalkia purinilytica TaxID=1503 RepID=A0A0L0W9A3_GOTPU|nr:hypothetical protein [Gottschalkia purinilytica]KNF08124.1 hypothetical protein CLPU_9c00200 [Gottschalkia purinilytica]
MSTVNKILRVLIYDREERDMRKESILNKAYRKAFDLLFNLLFISYLYRINFLHKSPYEIMDLAIVLCFISIYLCFSVTRKAEQHLTDIYIDKLILVAPTIILIDFIKHKLNNGIISSIYIFLIAIFAIYMVKNISKNIE